MKVHVRQEAPSDHAAVHEVIRQAFEREAFSDHDEHHLVDRLRASEAFIPELSLVAEVEGQVVGHILFTKLPVGAATALALAPVSVLPAWQGQGIGGALIREGHRLARELGYAHSLLLGHAAYYPRFGYVPAHLLGITCPFDVPAEQYMACDLQDRQQRLEGCPVYPAAFGIA